MEAITAVVVTVSVAEVEPPITVTDAGTFALLLLEARVTVVPPVGAGPFKVTLAVEGLPPISMVGFSVRPVSPAGAKVRVAVWVIPLRPAVTGTEVVVETAIVVTVKVADVDPAATVVDAGTEALELPEDKVTDVPPVGAGPLSVTVPVEGLPPVTDVGLSLTPLSPGGVIAS